MNKIIYKSKIDWWLWPVFIIYLAIMWFSFSSNELWHSIIVVIGWAIVFVVLIFGCWYEISDDTLVIYRFFRPTKIPLDNIKDVKKTTGYLATAGMSSRRVTINLIDNNVLKTYLPVEISPKDRDGFIRQLIRINPDIKVIN